MRFWPTFNIKNIWKNSWPKKEDSLHPSLPQINKTLTAPQPQGPVLRAKIIKSYVYLSVILWSPTPQVSFALFTVLNFGFFVSYCFPKHSQRIKPLQYLCWPCFLVSFFGFFWSKQYFLPAGGTVSNRPGLFQLGSPVRFSPSQFHIGIYLVETVLD